MHVSSILTKFDTTRHHTPLYRLCREHAQNSAFISVPPLNVLYSIIT